MIAELYKKYAYGLWRYALSITKDEGKAEDVVQDAFIKIIDKEALLSGLHEKQREAYLVITVRHTAYNLMKRWDKYYPLALDAADNKPLPEDMALRIAEREEMEKALATLPETQRDVLTLHYYMDLPYKMIGQIMGIKESHAYVIAHRARAALRDYFTAEDREHGAEEKNER